MGRHQPEILFENGVDGDGSSDGGGTTPDPPDPVNLIHEDTAQRQAIGKAANYDYRGEAVSVVATTTVSAASAGTSTNANGSPLYPFGAGTYLLVGWLYPDGKRNVATLLRGRIAQRHFDGTDWTDWTEDVQALGELGSFSTLAVDPATGLPTFGAPEARSGRLWYPWEAHYKIGAMSNSAGQEGGSPIDPLGVDLPDPRIMEVSQGIDQVTYRAAPAGTLQVLRNPAQDDRDTGIGPTMSLAKRRLLRFPGIKGQAWVT
ncbi:MAG: hypothetical protein AAFP86_22250, partial [Planctomycetota bacterium]